MQIGSNSTLYAREAVARVYLRNTPKNLAKIDLSSNVSKFTPMDVIMHEMSIPVNNSQTLSMTKTENLKSAALNENARRVSEAFQQGAKAEESEPPSALKLLGAASCECCDSRKPLSDDEGESENVFTTPLRLFTCNCPECGKVYVSGSQPASEEDLAFSSHFAETESENEIAGQYFSESL